jgi:hypothetical protein
MVRAKFKVTRVSKTADNYGTSTHSADVVELHAAMGEENKSWSKWTPGGQITMTINNPDALNQFQPGEFFFVDFTPAPAKEADEAVVSK